MHEVRLGVLEWEPDGSQLKEPFKGPRRELLEGPKESNIFPDVSGYLFALQ